MRLLAKWRKIKGERKELAIVGHNVGKFDIAILLREMKRCDIDHDELTSIATHIIDTLQIANDDDVWEEISYDKPDSVSLGSLYHCFFGVELPRAHSALGDVRGNLAVLLKLDPTLKFAKKYMKRLSVNEL